MLVCPNPVNTNTFAAPSLEGDTPEFHAAIAGSANVLLNARWEASTPKVRWESDARHNQILYGYGPQDIVEEWVAGSDTNVILTGRSSRFAGGNGSAGTLVMENTGSSTYPTDIVIYAGGIMAGANPATAYCVARGASATNMKRSTDAYPRLKLDHVNGRVYLGGGSSAPTAYLDATGFHP